MAFNNKLGKNRCDAFKYISIFSSRFQMAYLKNTAIRNKFKIDII